MSYEVTGTVVSVGDTLTISDKFKKRDLVLSVSDGKYDQFVSFQFTNDNVNKLDNIGNGEEVVVAFNLKGREWTSPQGEVKYFNTLEGWRVKGGADEGNITQAPKPEPSKDADEDDLPF
jgi:hypothetical protein